MASPHLDKISFISLLLISYCLPRHFQADVRAHVRHKSRCQEMEREGGREGKEGGVKKKKIHIAALATQLQQHSSGFPKRLEEGIEPPFHPPTPTTPSRINDSSFEQTTIFDAKNKIRSKAGLCQEGTRRFFFDAVLWERRTSGAYCETTHALKKYLYRKGDDNVKTTYPYPLLCQLQPTGLF